MFSYNLPSALWQSVRGLLRAIAVTRVWNEHRTRVTTKLTPEKKILPPHLPGFELATFRSRVLRSANKLTRQMTCSFFVGVVVVLLWFLAHLRAMVLHGARQTIVVDVLRSSRQWVYVTIGNIQNTALSAQRRATCS